MAKRGKTYSREFKIEAVKLSYNSDKGIEDIAADLGVSKSSLFRWRKEFGEDPDQAFPGKGQSVSENASNGSIRLKQATHDHPTSL
jgi:transposase